jgi:hypothetical protein
MRELLFNWTVVLFLSFHRYSLERKSDFFLTYLLNIYIIYIYIRIWLPEWGGAPTIVTGPGSVSSLSGSAGGYTSSPPCVFMSCFLIKHFNNFYSYTLIWFQTDVSYLCISLIFLFYPSLPFLKISYICASNIRISIKVSEGLKFETIVLSCDRVTTDGVWIGNWIYWNLTERNCK